MDDFAKFYTDTMSSIGNKNKLIIDSVRNSIEHGHFNYNEKGDIEMHDQTNQNDDRTIKFVATSSPEDLCELTKEIESNSKEDYLISDFVKQLKMTLDADTFNETWNNLQKLSNIVFGKELDLDITMEKTFQEALAIDLKLAAETKSKND